MDVKFIATTSAKLSELSVVSGQLIYLSDLNATYYDMGTTRRLMSSMRLVPSLPSSSDAQQGVLYGVVNAAGHIDASIWDGSAYHKLSGYVATTTSLGLVQPDGTTITVDANGVISCHPEVTSLPAASITYDNSTSGLAATSAQAAIDEVKTVSDNAVTSASNAVTQAQSAATAAANASTAAAAAQQNAANASTAASAAQSAADTAAGQVAQFESRISALESHASTATTRIQSLEAVAAIALTTEG